MNREKFLKKQILNAFELREEFISFLPFFATLDKDGDVESFAAQLDSEERRNSFDSFMRKRCENPKIVASVFVLTTWSTGLAENENKRPRQYPRIKEMVTAIYSTRDNLKEVHTYNADQKGNLEPNSIKILTGKKGLF